MLTVLNVAFPFAPVGPDAVGGAEQVLFAIDSALVEAGHRSLVMARRGSVTGGELFPIDAPAGTIDDAVRNRVWTDMRAALERLLGRRSIDVVHFHGLDCTQYLPASHHYPLVVTLHLPIDWYPAALFERKDVLLTCVSDWQRANADPSLKIAATIEAGVDLERFRPSSASPGAFALCLGRICPEKGYDGALRAARLAGVALAIAGAVFPYEEHERYLARELLPLLDERRRLIGPVAGSAKRRLLAGARCLVVPSRVAETSSLVVMEAQASATPVIAYAIGALPHLIEHGRTGLVVADESELVSAFERVRAVDRRACRLAAERRFDIQRCTAEYLAFYRAISKKAVFAAGGAQASSHAT